MFATDEINLNYSHVERLIVGGAIPVRGALTLEAVREAGSNPFLARRELGVINIGGAGKITVGRIPAGRWGTPQDLGGAAVFLASSASDYVHGAIIPVDGGWLAR